MPALQCPVRSCGEPLEIAPEPGAGRAVCPRGHSFDRARSGVWNLLQPQDRRSLRPGDSKAAALARRRLADQGIDAPFFAALLPILDHALGASGAPAVLDVGCGEGSFLAFLAERRDFDACGTDLSAPALDLAARRTPKATWVVANADRRLPFPDRAFDLVTSLTARRNPTEFARLLAPTGQFLLALPGPDDLIELRAEALGSGDRRERLPGALAEFAAGFEVLETRRVDWTVRLDDIGIRDLLATTYRGGRTG